MKPSLAIAYAVKKNNKKASGGMIEPKAAMPQSKDMVHLIIAKKMAAGGMVNELNKSADYELAKEDGALEGNIYGMDDGEGEMPLEEDLNYIPGNDVIADDMHDKLPGDAEHEVEGMGSSRQAMARKGMLTKIMGRLAAKHAGR
jgi:hypothetical protein